MPVEVVRFVFNAKDIVIACNKKNYITLKGWAQEKVDCFHLSVMATI